MQRADPRNRTSVCDQDLILPKFCIMFSIVCTKGHLDQDRENISLGNQKSGLTFALLVLTLTKSVTSLSFSYLIHQG